MRCLYIYIFGYKLIKNKNIDSLKLKFKHSQFRNDRMVVKYANRIYRIFKSCNREFCPGYVNT